MAGITRHDLNAETVHARHVLHVVPVDAVTADLVVAEATREEPVANRTQHLGAALVMAAP